MKDKTIVKKLPGKLIKLAQVMQERQKKRALTSHEQTVLRYCLGLTEASLAPSVKPNETWEEYSARVKANHGGKV